MLSSSTLAALYRANQYHVSECAGCLLVGFKPGAVSVVVKECWNTSPVGKPEAEEFYAQLRTVGSAVGCRHFRVIAYGGYRESALAFELYGLTLSDGRYVESLASGRHIELYPHNEAAYRAIEAGFLQHRIGAVVQATGTGKSFLIARYLLAHATDRILVIAPNRTILDEIRRATGKSRKAARSEEKKISSTPASFPEPPVIYCTFQALARSRGKTAFEVDHILIDEFHHTGAEIWGDALREVIEANPSARVLGTSATPVRPEGMIDTVDVYFEGNLFYELTLPEAWHYGILPIPVLVQSMYGLGDRLDKIQHTLDRADCSPAHRAKIQEKLDAARIDFKNSLGAVELIRQFLPLTVRKLLVFCRDKADLHEMIPLVTGWLAEAGRKTIAFAIHNDQSDRENRRLLAAFREESDRLHVLFSINMLIEGLHVEGVDAALFLRRTESYVVTLQQLGRCLKAGSTQPPVILDFVNNFSGRSVYHVLTCDLKRLSKLQAPRGFEGVSDFRVTGFFADIRQRVRDILAELEPWQLMYERLSAYRAAEADWPAATEGKLGLWCHTQRMAKKRGALSPERIARLDAIGFEWEQQDSEWSKNYEKLKDFYAREGRWPRRGEGSLGTWCNTQRQVRKNGKLTKERIRRLDTIGFVWAYDGEKEWLKNYETLDRFRALYHRFPKSTEGRLGRWCVTQRKMRNEGQLAPERIRLLEQIGFPWSVESLWLDHFRQLQAFQEAEGRWPTSREGALGSWCAVQRRLFKKGQLSPERAEKLKKNGFPLGG